MPRGIKEESSNSSLNQSPKKRPRKERQSSNSETVEEPLKKRNSVDVLQNFKVYHIEIVEQIRNYLCETNHFPQSLFIYGTQGTGKTQILSSLLPSIVKNVVIVNCNECYTSKILFETILNGMFDYKLSSHNNYLPHTKCDNARDFLDALEICDPFVPYVIVIDGAEKLMKMDDNILPMFLRLKEMCDLNICCVLVSTYNIDWMCPKDNLVHTIVIYWPQYTKKQILNILLDKLDAHKACIANHLVLASSFDSKYLKSIVDAIDINFFENYLHLFLNVTFRYCRDLRELIQASQECFKKYCEPILNGTCDMTDVQMLYRNISETLKTSMIKTYNTIDQDSNTVVSVDRLITTESQQLELPFFAKYFLIAAFLASHNDARSDKRLFMKHHGKQRKRVQDIKSKAVSEKLNTQLGPRSFILDRLFAIFYAIIDDKISLNCNLMSQIPTLVRLKLLTYVSGENNLMDGNARLQCTVGLDFIIRIGKSVGFNVAQHLCDFL